MTARDGQNVTLSGALACAIAAARNILVFGPDHDLPPWQRLAVYTALAAADRHRGQRASGCLAISTARKVLPISSGGGTGDRLAEHVLHTAELVMRGSVSRAHAEDIAGRAWEQLEDSGRQASQDTESFYAKEAAVIALFEVLGRDPLHTVVIREGDTNEVLDPWSTDAALCAALAYAGGPWEPRSDPARRLEFWEWWLADAIPRAWNMAARGL